MAATVAALKDGGVLPFANSNRIHLVPPAEHERRGRPGGWSSRALATRPST